MTVTLLIGLVPALRSTASPQNGSRVIAIDVSSRGRGVHKLLVIQMALSLVLTIAAGLFARTLFALETIDPGFDRTHLVAIDLGANVGTRFDSRVRASGASIGGDDATLYDRVSDRVRYGRNNDCLHQFFIAGQQV